MAKVTIYSIAESLGIAASTVSRAMTRPELVKADLRDRILARAEELGYQPNRTARRLATGLTGAIGLLVPDITNPYFPPLVRAIQTAAAADDATTVILVDAGGSADDEEGLIRRLKSQVDGILIASPLTGDADLREAVGATPAVVLNREIEGMHSVIVDVTSALHEAADHLVSLGHERVALLTGTVGSWAATQRRDAIRSWAAATGVDLEELGPFDASYDGGVEAAGELLRTGATAAFAFDDLTACGVVAGLSEAGCQVPEDRSVVGCDDVLLARALTPNLTTVGTPNEELGEAAVAALHALIAGETPAPTPLSGRFIARRSTGPANPAGA